MGMSFHQARGHTQSFSSKHSRNRKQAGKHARRNSLDGRFGIEKYINQVPHTDHCVCCRSRWKSTFAEYCDYDILDEEGEEGLMEPPTLCSGAFLQSHGLVDRCARRAWPQLHQGGEWCDPMNMVGYKRSKVFRAG